MTAALVFTALIVGWFLGAATISRHHAAQAGIAADTRRALIDGEAEHAELEEPEECSL